jgi:hypothetical protein
MRTKLKPYVGERHWFQGYLVSISDVKIRSRESRPGQRVLVRHLSIEATGEYVADHVWINITSGLLSAKIPTRHNVRFRARVQVYIKRKGGCFVSDYCLVRPFRFSLI